MQSFVPVFTALTAALLSIAPIQGVAARNVQEAIEELAARESGGGATLPNAGTVAASPAQISLSPEFGGFYGPLDVKVGEGATSTFSNPDYLEPAVFLQSIVDSGLAVDENGENPLSFEVQGPRVYIRSNTYFSLSGVGALTAFGKDVFLSPGWGFAYDTTVMNVRAGSTSSVGDYLVRLEMLAIESQSRIVGKISHAAGNALSGIATAITIEHRDHLLTYSINGSAASFAAYVNGFFDGLVATIDPVFGNVILQSTAGRPIVIGGDPEAIAAIFGSLPAAP